MPESYLDMGSQAGGGYGLPKLPSLQEVLGSGGASADPGTIFKLLQAPQARMTDVLPSLRELLIGSQGPALQAIRQGAESNAAMAQSDAMRRGLTGSDIEMANIRGAREAGTMQQGQLIAQQSSALAQYVMQALGMDIQANREMFVTLAQALGQELGAQRDMQMAELARHEGAENRKNALWGAGIGAVGSIAGGGLGGFMSRKPS